MHKVLRRQWTCANCLRQQLRRNSTATAAASTSDVRFDDAYVQARPKTERDALRKVFNSVDYYLHFSQSALSRSTGLVGNHHLTSPRGFQKFAETSLAECKKLVDRTLRASTYEEYGALPRDLDRLSDLLCRVIDLSDFIRSNHPDPRIATAATTAYSRMLQYMNELNTTTGLNDQLQKAWNIPEVRSRWNQEEIMVAQILIKDFAKSGIDLPEKQREQFVDISNDIAAVGTDFTMEMEAAQTHVSLPASKLGGLDPSVVKKISSFSRAHVPTYSSLAKMALASVHDSGTRKEIYEAERTASRRTVDRLEKLLLKRAELAQLTGHPDFAHMNLSDKMSKTPRAVNNFLLSLNQGNKGQVQAELAQLLQVKQQLENKADRVDAWDHGYLLNRLYKSQPKSGLRTSKSRLYDSTRAYFSLGNVMQGLSSLFESLYGIRLVPKATLAGETWDPEVRRLDVYSDRDEHIATMYCDLFSRPGKPPNPAHFTLMCSREISDEEIQEAVHTGQPLNNGMPTLKQTDPATGKTKQFQIPVIALVCDFQQRGHSKSPSLLHPMSVVTLFHEMGHAVHSFLGRTSMQGIAGTRCATDFAELPSILMEYFAMHPDVLKLFARHWETDAAMPNDMIHALKAEQSDRAEKSGGWENENQILMAMLDQVYHSTGPVAALQNGKYDSTAAYHQVWDAYGSVREPAGTAWQGFFGHLYGYGSTYYSYLFDRAIARQVWRSVFRDGAAHGAIDRSAGQHFADEVLRWGGGRDPWHCLEGLMGQGRGVLAEGGEAAMLEVGKWGIDAGVDEGV
jgi:mitochondrial intermediate peptidase